MCNNVNTDCDGFTPKVTHFSSSKFSAKKITDKFDNVPLKFKMFCRFNFIDFDERNTENLMGPYNNLNIIQLSQKSDPCLSVLLMSD